MSFYFTVIFGILTLINSTFGGQLHGLAYSAASRPLVNYNYGRIASYASPVISSPSPVAAEYSTRFTAYAAVPLTTSVAAPALFPRQYYGGLVRAFGGSSHSRNSGFSNSLIRQGISAYAAVPIAGYRASFEIPSIRAYGASSLRNFPAALNIQGLYPSAVGFDDFAGADPQVHDQRAFGIFENENQLSGW